MYKKHDTLAPVSEIREKFGDCLSFAAKRLRSKMNLSSALKIIFSVFRFSAMTSSRSKDGGGLMSRIRNALFALPAVILVFLASCAGTDETAFGQSVDRAGVITDRSLAFTFAAPRGKRARKTFRLLYFQGDTVLLQLPLSRVSGKMRRGGRIHQPQTGERFNARAPRKNGEPPLGILACGEPSR
jgi:hypothetical protein